MIHQFSACTYFCLGQRNRPETQSDCFALHHLGNNPDGYERCIEFFERVLEAAQVLHRVATRQATLIGSNRRGGSGTSGSNSSGSNSSGSNSSNGAPGTNTIAIEAELRKRKAAKLLLAVKVGIPKFQLLLSHLMQCKWDELVTEKRLQTLGQKQYSEIQDYKMKLLEMWYRKDSTQWYGKRGISGHTTMFTKRGE